jgi:uncharacterized protein (DUF58 family)
VSGAGWQPTAALLRVTVVPGALLLTAVLLRRVDLLAVAAPLALAAVPLVRRPAGRPAAELTISEDQPGEGAVVQATVRVADAAGAETMTAAVATPQWVRPAGGRRLAGVVPVGDDGAAALTVDLRADRWGRSAVGPGLVTLSAAGGLLRCGPLPLREQQVAVVPLAARFRGATQVPRARGNVGVHRSPRLGDGTELSGIRPFAPGDRLRRINWRVSLRTGELQVNATTTERDADVLLLLDARYDAGTSTGVDGSASGIDRAVRATAALAEFYLGLGDRVGLVAYTATARQQPARAGRGQLARLLQALLDVAPPSRVGGEPALPEPAGLDPRALVLVISPLVGRHVFERTAALARAGHTVVAVDTLPENPAGEAPDAWSRPVFRLWRLERDVRISQLRGLGVPVARWQGPGSLDSVLADLSRVAARGGRSR